MMKRTLFLLLFSAGVCGAQVVSPMPATQLSGLGAPSGTITCNVTVSTPASAATYIQRDALPGQALWICSLASDGVTYAWTQRPSAIATGLTGSIGGSSLVSLGCSTGTATVAGAVVGSNAAFAAPLGNPGSGLFSVTAYVSAANTVTVSVCNLSLVSLTPAATTYKVLMY